MALTVARSNIQPADLASISEFNDAINLRVTQNEIGKMANDLDAKSATMISLIEELRLDKDPLAAGMIIDQVVVSRRRKNEIFSAFEESALKAPILQLADETLPFPDRISGLVELLAPLGELTRDLPFEIIHFLDPEHFALATNWVWNPQTETGAVALLLNESYSLFGDDDTEDFERLNFALHYLAETARAAGFLGSGGSPFALDVFMSGVYAIYMSTVLEMRMTKEFNKILPPLPQLMRRLLGIYRREAVQ